MTKDLQSSRPLPVVLKPAPDELLSSWLSRHAAFYGVSPLQLLRHLLPDLRVQKIEAVDARLPEDALERLARFLRRPRADIEHMTHSEVAGEARRFVSRTAVHACNPCRSRNRDPEPQRADLRGEHRGWRITCPSCGAKLSPPPGLAHAGTECGSSDPVCRIWDEAVEGERLLDRLLSADDETARAAVAAFRMLLVRRARPPPACDPPICRAVDALVPGFDDLARRCGPSHGWASPLIAPLPLRSVLLAGFRRLLEKPGPASEILRHVTLGNYRLRIETLGAKASPILGPLFPSLTIDVINETRDPFSLNLTSVPTSLIAQSHI